MLSQRTQQLQGCGIVPQKKLISRQIIKFFEKRASIKQTLIILLEGNAPCPDLLHKSEVSALVFIAVCG
jgi:hypothetical protein